MATGRPCRLLRPCFSIPYLVLFSRFWSPFVRWCKAPIDMKATSASITPWILSSAASASRITSHHSGLDPLPESAMAGLVRGISIRMFTHGAPVGKTHKIPFRTARRSFRTDLGCDVAWWALEFAGQGSSVFVCQDPCMAHSVLMRYSSPAQRLVGDNW
jgi:hypothetical protein